MDNGFFDKLQDAVIVAGKEISEAASEFSSRAKLRYEIRARETYLDELYKELGKKYYAECKEKNSGEEKVESGSFEEIDNLLKELKELRDELSERQGASACPRCGAQVALESDYCGKCGAYMREDEE